MKYIIQLSIILLISKTAIIAQTTATDFTVNDCVGNSHHLFGELDAGKVIVIDWVMPCASCIAPSIAAYNAVQSYAASHPGQVLFYLADDVANTTCATLTSWGNTNGLTNAVKFSNAAISMNDYGTAGMPKIVVLGGANHTIFYNQNSGVTTSNVQAAIDAALLVAGINEDKNATKIFNVFPNPTVDKLGFEYYVSEKKNIKIQICDIYGKIIIEEIPENGSIVAGVNKREINIENLDSGIYFLQIKTDTGYKVKKFVVSK